MLSGILENVLVKFLGRYVDGIKNNIDVGITGNATIQKISLRPEFINELGLPFTLKYSHISKMIINVPWASLKQKPTTVTIQGIYVLLALKYDDLEEISINPKERFDQILARVKEQLKKKIEEKQANKTESFAQKSVIRIIDNLIISIDEIHVRVQSMKRDWDFSFGVIFDKISSFTVNQYGQKTFYTRHFSNKELNAPLKKSFVCQRFQIYWNDKETFFMCEKQDKNKGQLIKNLLAQPFQSKSLLVNQSKKTPQKGAVTEFKPSYEMKILTRFSFDLLAEQKLSADKKYIVELKGQLPKVSFLITDIQISQILVACELIYEWIIEKEKNGMRNFIFDEKAEEEFKKVLLKRYKQQGVTVNEINNLYTTITQTPLEKLENAADNLIREYRISKQMKKIQKIQNKQKSKEMMQKFLERVENQNPQIVQLFQHIIIELSVPQFKLSCMKDDRALLQIGLNSIMSDVKLVLSKHTLVTVNISELFVRMLDGNEQKNLVIFQKPEYSKQPFTQFSMTMLQKSPPIIKAHLKKRYIVMDEKTLSNLVIWVSRIKMKPPLVNFISEQMNYSIYITQEMFAMLFKAAEFNLNINIEVPILALKLHEVLQLNYGTFWMSRESENEYCIEITEKQQVRINETQIVQFKQGNRISLLNMKPQTVKIELKHLIVKNLNTIFKFGLGFIKHQKNLIQQFQSLEPVVQEEIIFEGKFFVNEHQTAQNMLLQGNYLKFLPSKEKIHLLRTKMYPFQKKGKFGLIFREEVQKQINIVLMDSEKLMYTLFETIKQHMLYICTIPQWKKYYQKFPNRLVTEVNQIQKQQENVNLIDLHLLMEVADFYLGETKLGQTILNLNSFKGLVNYKQYNTDAKADVGCLNLNLGKEKLIENLAISVKYSYIQFMRLILNVLTLRVHIENYEAIEQIINLSTEYTIMIDSLKNQLSSLVTSPVQDILVQQRVINPEDISYLLESNVTIQLSNVQAYIIGFRNSVKNACIDLSKYRNSSLPNISLKVRKVIFMSSITLTGCELSVANNKIDIDLFNLAIYLSFQLLFYELTTGRGHFFINSLINLVKSKKKKIEQNRSSGEKEKSLPSISLNIKGFKTRFRLTQNEQISTYIHNTVLKICRNEQDKNVIDIDSKWNRFGFIINNNVILEPISGKASIKCDKQFLPHSVQADIQPIIVNISVHKLIESVIVIKISMERVLGLQIVRAMLVQKLKANNPRLQNLQKIKQPEILIRIQSVKVLLYNSKDWQLLRLKIDSINLDTHKGKDNQIQISVEHLNSIFRIYEPILEKTKIIVRMREGPQVQVRLKDIRFNISEQLTQDMIKQLILTKQNVQRALKEVKFDVNQQSSFQNELEKYKNILSSMIVPQQLFQQEEEEQQRKMKEKEKRKSNEKLNDKKEKEKQRNKEKYHTCILFIQNHLHLQALIQIKIDEQKSNFHLKAQNKGETEIKFQVKSEYNNSHEMIEKYKQIGIKLSLIHEKYYTKSMYFSVFMHKQAYYYHETNFGNDKGQQAESAIGLIIRQQPNSTNYVLDIVSAFKVMNTTEININLNWTKGQDVFQRQLKQGQYEWVSPWVNDKVTINPNSDHLYASSYEVNFSQAHNLYEINLNNSVVNEVSNYCCLTIERELFKLEKWYKRNRNEKGSKPTLKPAVMLIKPTYYVINHFHSNIFVNDIQCKHKQKIPLYSMFRQKNQSFIRLKFGDGSMHEVFLPKDGQTNSVQLKLANENYTTISILRQKSLQNTNLPNRNQCVYHIYAKLQLILTFPKSQNLTLVTNILSTRYILKKQIQINGGNFEHQHPSVIEGQQSSLTRDRFIFHSYIHILDQYEKYLQIKSANMYCKEVTLYPSYYGNDLNFYKAKPVESKEMKEGKQKQKQNQKEEIFKKFSINYEFTKINQQTIMYYVSILPKYYVLNLSLQNFNIDGQGITKFNERIVVDSDQVQVTFVETGNHWQMLNKSNSINLNEKKQLIFFRKVLFKQHQFNQYLKNKKLRKLSRTIEQSEVKVQQKSLSADLSKPGSLNKEEKAPQLMSNQSEEKNKKVIIQTENLRVFQIMKHTGSYSATTFCLKEWNEWVSIHNNLDRTIVATSSYIYQQLQITIETVIQAGQVGLHPYGIQNIPTIEFYIIGNGQKLLMGSYQTSHRFNDQIELVIPQQNQQANKSEIIAMYETRVKRGRKVVFSFLVSNQVAQMTDLKKLKSLIIPAFLKISQSLKIVIENMNASIIVGHGRLRKQLIRLCSKNIDLLLLVYPSGLYMFQAMLGLQLQAPQFPELVLNLPNVQFYLEAIQSKFIERVTLKVPKTITVFLTDKLLIDILNLVTKSLKQIVTQQQIFNNNPNYLARDEQGEGLYTSSLNSVMISQIQAKVTIKKVLIENNENQKKIVEMGLSIIQLEGSSIKLSKVDIEQPVNSKHLNDITKKYVMQIIFGCLGGLNLIGNPHQFMDQIEAGRTRGKPLIGFVGGVLAGTANSMSKIISTVSNSVSNLSMDYEYQRQRNQSYMNQPKGFANGIKHGSKSLMTSIKSGFVGLFTKPQEGLKQQGGIGLIKGTFQGLTGLIVKPVTGIMDAASMTVQGIRSASSYNQNSENQFLNLEKPLYHKFKIIRPYDKTDELVYNSLVRIFRDNEKTCNDIADIVEAFILQDQKNREIEEAIIVTPDKLYLINYKNDQIELEIRHENMGATGHFLEGVVLYYNDKNESDQGFSETNDSSQIVFRITSPIKKLHLYSTLKAFIDLYAQSKDNQMIPED